jgi:hypothetical protein
LDSRKIGLAGDRGTSVPKAIGCAGQCKEGEKMSVTDGELSIPDGTIEDPEAFEIIRVWVSHEGRHVILRFDACDDPGAWGIVLADLMRHLSNAYEQGLGLDRKATFDQIKAVFQAEIDSPTDNATGFVA